jgi:hypothetical protein
MQIRAKETNGKESKVGKARCEAHHLHLSSLFPPERGLHRLRDWQAAGVDSGAVAGEP